MKTQTILLLVGGSVAAYLAYQWYMGQGTQTALPAPGAGTDTSGGTTGTDTSGGYGSGYGSGPGGAMQDPSGGYPGGGYGGMFLPPPMMPPPVPYGQPGHALAFGAWFAQLPPARRAALAKLPWAQKLAQYHAYAAWWNRTHQAA